MTPKSAFPNTVMSSVINSAKNYLANEVGINVTQVRKTAGGVDQLQLQEYTVIIAIGGSISKVIAFSFSRDFIDTLYSRLTAGLDLPQSDEPLYRRAAATETTNIIVGHCMEDLSAHGERLSISPPILLEEAKRIHRMKSSTLSSVSLVTAHGCFDIDLVEPEGMFHASLENMTEDIRWNG